ncbi:MULTISPECIES: MarR family transcriptional regulator [unclassified Corynebacterium]|uniref:MarR family winged helix-turn-helix transcriptional regulator n=1 Tax=unclassified Corynebacterium TaxID=2624378 RepID=UPI0029C9F554|nr:MULTISPECIES: MarR family transcriptional regulator [unclassified Corynebacterium]WPF66097.1 MarR family transcriptional regulator [Corynebacterium sp. 22KM0430]WPF68589.1 MarR family transcriptional regulator [Corynebacterium sp. 21KM1197]
MNSPTPDVVARKVRPALTKLYVMYFRMASQSNLTGPQLSIMTRMKENGESRISHLAKEEGIRMPTASNALHQLEQRGMVERLRDTHDRRGVRVRLTDLGMAELERVGEERTQNLTEMLEKLSPEELRRADEFVDVINVLASKYGVPESPQ